MNNPFIPLFERDIKRLYKEINAYTDDQTLWRKAEGITNPAGNLCLHLVGNMSEYIGRQIGGIPYQRDRPLEFSATGLSKQALLDKVTHVEPIVLQALNGLTEAKLAEKFPENVLGYDMTVHFFLVHLYGHLNYHLGQINYHRRILNT